MRTMALWRRALLGSALSLPALRRAASQGPGAGRSGPRLMLLGHAVHRASLNEGAGGDPLAEWVASGGARPDWITLGVTEAHDRLFREASLTTGAVDVAFVLNRYLSGRIGGLFLPLDGQDGPLAGLDLDDTPAVMRAALTFDGRLHGLPFRQATSGLLWNETLLAEQGLNAAPRTPDELLAAARALSARRGDGPPVSGLVMDGPGPSQMIDLARMWDGDFVAIDLSLRVEEPAMVRALDILRALFAEGVLPRAFPRFSTELATTAMQQGRAAMAITPISRHAALNDPRASRYPGKIHVAAVPAAPEIAARYPVAPVKSEFWSLAIPRNSRNVPAAARLLRHLAGREATLRAALNGNGPVRLSVLADPRYAATAPYAAVEAEALHVARPPLPGWENASRAEDVFREEVERMLVGNVPAAQTAAAIASRVRPLL